MTYPTADPRSLDVFYAVTVHRTFATARRVARDRDVAWDATQDAYAVMVNRWSERQYRSPRDNQRYVTGIAVNKVVDWYRLAVRLEPLASEDDHPVEEDGYARILDELTVFKEVRLVLACQPVVMRAVGILYFLEGFSYQEIADSRGVSASTVRSQVQLLRGRLKPLVNRVIEAGERP